MRSGLKHFCAGASITMFDWAIRSGRLEISPVAFLHHIEAIPLAVVASINGSCVGGGYGLALACDFVNAARTAKIGSVEVTLGLEPVDGGRAAAGAARWCAAGEGDVHARPPLRRRHPGELERQAALWASDDLRTALESFHTNGPGLARFARK